MDFDPQAFLAERKAPAASKYPLPFDESDFKIKRGRAAQFDPYIDLFAQDYDDLPDIADLTRAVLLRESGGRTNAASPAGAVGLMQMLPGTYADMGGQGDPMNAIESIDKGMSYLAQQYRKFGSAELALAAYNAGPGSVRKHKGIPPFKETQEYVPAVMGYMEAIRGGQTGSAAPPETPSVAFDPAAFLAQRKGPEIDFLNSSPIPGIPGQGGEKLAQFDTPLEPKKEKEFQNWLAVESKRRGRDVSKDLEDYDLRGYWLDGGAKDKSGKGHMPDTYKKPNHPTFSVESKYHGVDLGNGKVAQGGSWEGDSGFIPGETNISTHGIGGLKEYFARAEPGVQLKEGEQTRSQEQARAAEQEGSVLPWKLPENVAAAEQQKALTAQHEALGNRYLEEKKKRPFQVFTPERMAAREGGQEDKRSFLGQTLGDILGTARNVTAHVSAKVTGKSYAERQGERYAATAMNLAEEPVFKEAKRKLDAGEGLTPEEEEVMKAHPGFVKALGEFAKTAAKDPIKTAGDFGVAMIEDLPAMLLGNVGVVGTLAVLSKVGQGWKAARSLAYAEKLAQRATEARLAKPGAAVEIAKDVGANAVAGPVSLYPEAKARGEQYGGTEAARDVVTGAGFSFLGAPAKILRSAKDPRPTVAELRSHPAIAEMMPKFQHLLQNPETSGINWLVKPKDEGQVFMSRADLEKAGYPHAEPGVFDVPGEFDSKTGTVTLRRIAGPETQIEEAVHFLQKQIRDKSAKFADSGDPQLQFYTSLQEKITDWENSIRAEAKRRKMEIPSGDELFGQVMTAHMGYADAYADGPVPRIVLPDAILEDFRKVLGEAPELQGSNFPEGGDLAAASAFPDYVHQPKKPPVTRYPAAPKNEPDLSVEALGEVQAQGEAPKAKPKPKGPEELLVIPMDVMRAKMAARRAQIEIPDEMMPKPVEPQEPGLPPRRPAPGTPKSPSNFPPPANEPEAMRKVLNQAGRRPLEEGPVPEVPPEPKFLSAARKAYAEKYNHTPDDPLIADLVHEPVTGLLSRHAYEADLKDKKLGKGHASIDVGGLKPVNDRFGHAGGDKLLQTAARILAEEVDKVGGRAYRSGGDEMQIRAKDADLAKLAARSAKERLRNHKVDFEDESGNTIGSVPGIRLDYGYDVSPAAADAHLLQFRARAEALPPEHPDHRTPRGTAQAGTVGGLPGSHDLQGSHPDGHSVPGRSAQRRPDPEVTTLHIGQHVAETLTRGKAIHIHPDDAKLLKLYKGESLNPQAMNASEMWRTLGKPVRIDPGAPRLSKIAHDLNEGLAERQGEPVHIVGADAPDPEYGFHEDDLAAALLNRPKTKEALKKEIEETRQKFRDLDEAEALKAKHGEPQIGDGGYPADWDAPAPAAKAGDADEGPLFPLRRAPPKTSQEDMFAGKGRVAGQGPLKGKDGDLGLEGLPLTGETAKQAAAEEAQQRLLQLRPARKPPESAAPEQKPRAEIIPFPAKAQPAAGGSLPPIPLDEPRLAGAPPRVEVREGALRQGEVKTGKPPANLDRETARSWDSLDKEVQQLLMTHGMEHFEQAMKHRTLSDVEVMAFDSIVRQKAEAMQAAQEALAQATGKARPAVEAQALAAAGEYTAAQMMQINGLTETARALAAAARRMRAASPTDAPALVRALAKSLPDVGPKDLATLIHAWKTTPEQFPDLLRAYANPGKLKKLGEFYRAGLLSWVPTHIRNVAGNFGESLVRLTETPLAGGLDALAQAALGGKRTRYAGEVGAEVVGLSRSFPGALRNLSAGLKSLYRDEAIDPTLPAERQLGAVGAGKVGHVEKAVGKYYTRPIFKLLAIEDRFFRDLGGTADMHRLALRQALSEGKTGQTAARRAEVVMREAGEGKHPEILREVKRMNDERVFQEDPGQFVRTLSHWANTTPLAFFLPFVRTPANLAKRTLQRTPFGFLKAGKEYKAWRKAVDEGAPAEEIAQHRGEAMDAGARALVGSTLISGFAALSATGIIGMTGGGPEDKKGRNLLKESGWQPYSFFFTVNGEKQWVPYAWWEPVSSLLGMAADIGEAKSDEGFDYSLAAQRVAYGLTSKTYLTSLIDLAEFVQGVTKGEAGAAGVYASKFAGGWVPQFIGRAAQGMDPVLRDVKPTQKGLAGVGERVEKTIKARIPVLSETVPPVYSATGESVKRTGPGVSRWLSPAQTTSEREEAPLVHGLQDAGYVPPDVPREITLKGPGGRSIKATLTAAERAQLAEAQAKVSKKLAERVKAGSWSVLQPDRQKKILRNAYDDAQDRELDRIRQQRRQGR